MKSSALEKQMMEAFAKQTENPEKTLKKFFYARVLKEWTMAFTIIGWSMSFAASFGLFYIPGSGVFPSQFPTYYFGGMILGVTGLISWFCLGILPPVRLHDLFRESYGELVSEFSKQLYLTRKPKDYDDFTMLTGFLYTLALNVLLAQEAENETLENRYLEEFKRLFNLLKKFGLCADKWNPYFDGAKPKAAWSSWSI